MKRAKKLNKGHGFSFADDHSGVIYLPEGITLKYENGICIEYRVPKKSNDITWTPNRT